MFLHKDRVVQWHSGRWTCDQQVAGSSPSSCAFGCNLGQAVHTRASITKQHNLVLVQAVKVTVGMASH